MIKGNLISWLLLDEGQYDNIKLDDNNAISLHQIFKIIHLISHRGSFNSQRNCDNVTMVVNPTVGLSDKPASGHNQYTVEVGIFTIRPFLPMKKEKRTCEIFLSPVSFSFSTWEREHTKYDGRCCSVFLFHLKELKFNTHETFVSTAKE